MRRSTINNSLIMLHNPNSPHAESFRTLRTNIQFSSLNNPIKTIVITSSQRGEGKTTTASNLSVAYAQEGKRVLLMDTDLRDPSIHHVFSCSNKAGLVNILADQLNWREAVQEGPLEHLSILTAGPLPPNPSEMLSSYKMHALMDELKEQLDIIIIDTPPVLAFTDSLVISSCSDGVVLVVSAGKVEKDIVKKAKASLEHANARITGLVINRMNRKERKNQLHYIAK